MRYITHIGKAGVYGEIRVISYRDTARRPLASYQENNDGTDTITLYSKGKGHSRTLPRGKSPDICLAHLLELGYDTLDHTSADFRAYND